MTPLWQHSAWTFAKHCSALTSQGKLFQFSLKIGKAFSFTLDSRCKDSLVSMTKKRASPSTLRRNARRNTPSYKKTILKSKQPVSGIDFFFRFSPRLSENDYSRVKFIAKFVPTASNLRYFGLNCCVFSVKSVVRGHERVGYELELLIFLEKHIETRIILK